MIAAGGRPDTADTAGLVCALRPVTSVVVWFALFVSGICTIPVFPLFRSGRGLWSNQSAAGSVHFCADVTEYRNRNSNQSVDLINQYPDDKTRLAYIHSHLIRTGKRRRLVIQTSLLDCLGA